MPPNLGGFFMVRSYYPSECHADYFDFERIEALKPAIEACGISTLSQSPMLGFHKQMDNRIKLLEEILSFRMQGVEFDNGDMYVDGHKAASEVRDEFVSVFYQAEDGIRDLTVTGVQTCALPISTRQGIALGNVRRKFLYRRPSGRRHSRRRSLSHRNGGADGHAAAPALL